MKLTCDVCPHLCSISDGESGKCGVWRNKDNQLENPFYGKCSLITVEPVEKKPFFHYKPGSKCLSVGFVGCNFSCDFCQNYTVSQETDAKTIHYSPDDLVSLCRSKDLSTIAFSYNEPTLYWEYIRDVAASMDVLVKTNGFAAPWVYNELSICSGFNVDIKGNEYDYKKVCRGALRPVLNSIQRLVQFSHVEISYLIVPERIQDYQFHLYLRDFLADLPVVVHLLYFYPFHRMVVPSYPPEELIKVAKLFRERVNYVYASNVYRSDIVPHRDTECSNCGQVMISRSTGKTIVNKIECCGEKIQGIF